MPSAFPSPLNIQGGASGAVPGGGTDVYNDGGAGAPAHTAPRGTLYTDTSSGNLYINTSAGATGNTWTLFATTGGFTFADVVGPSSSVTAKALTNYDTTITIPGGTLSVGDVITVDFISERTAGTTKANLAHVLRNTADGALLTWTINNLSGKGALASYVGRVTGTVRAIGAKGSIFWEGALTAPLAVNDQPQSIGAVVAQDTTADLTLKVATSNSAGAGNARTLQSFSCYVTSAT